MVRLANVLGSSGSVVPLFREQIASGRGRSPVNPPRDHRYFMNHWSGPAGAEAAASAQAREVFRSTLGETVAASLGPRAPDGSAPGCRTPRRQTIPTATSRSSITGIRPGEKLYEELPDRGTQIVPPPIPLIYIWPTRAPLKRRSPS